MEVVADSTKISPFVCYDRSSQKVPSYSSGLVLGGRGQGRSLVILMFCFFVLLFLLSGVVGAQELYYYKYSPLSPRETVTDWTEECGASEPLNAALQAFERDPTVTRAIDIYHLREELAGNDQLRQALIQENPSICFAIELALQEIVAHTNREVGAKKSLRMGSTGTRQMEILEWIRNGASGENIPVPDPQKWCRSDDDIMNLVDTGSVIQNLDANESVNGNPARDAFIRVTREVFHNTLYPEETETNFLSPTKAWPILREKYNIPTRWPQYLYAWTAQNEEKYNWVWGLAELERWGWDKGCETADVGNPIGSTDYLRKRREPPGTPPPNGRFAFIANNYRQIYDVHSGDFFYQCKYLTRMILAWKERLGDEAAAALPAAWEDAFDKALAVYMNGSDGLGTGTLRSEVLQTIDDVVFATHEYHLDRVGRSIAEALGKAKHGPGDRVSIEELLRLHPGLSDELDGLIVAYSNIPPDLHQKLVEQFAAKIQAFQSGQDESRVLETEILKRALEIVQDETSFQRRQIDAFRSIRRRVEENLADCLAGTDLEEFLRKVGKGDFSGEELRLVDWRVQRVKRQLSPEEVNREILFIKSVSVLMGWEQAEAATRLKEYFEQGPSTALNMMRRIYDIFDTSRLRPIHVEYQDANGAVRRTTIRPSGQSIGYQCFKAALYGYDIYGKVSSGRELYSILYQIYGRGGLSDEETGILQAQAFMAAFDVYELLRSDIMGAEIRQLPMSGTVSQIALGSPGAALADDQLAKDQLLRAAIKDALLLWNPGLGTAFVLYDLGSWAYTEHSIRSLKSEVIDAMVENGIWAIRKSQEGVQESSGPLTARQMKELKVGDEDNLQLLSVLASKDGAKIRKIMLVREETTIELVESGRAVEPRSSLKEFAYLKGYLDADPVIRAAIEAVEKLNTASNWFTAEPLPRNPEDWTWDSLADAGIVVNRREDQVSPISAGDVSFAPQFAGASAWGIDFRDPELVQRLVGNQQRLLGFLVMDFWAKQQRLLQEYLLPAMEKEAARRLIEKIKNESVEVVFGQEIEEIDNALKEIDRNLWPRIADSADPFPERGFNSEQDFPIYDSFKQSTSWVRNSLDRYQRFLEDPTQTELWDGTITLASQIPSNLDRAQVAEKGNELLQYMRDLYHLVKDGYDEVHGQLDQGEKLVSESGNVVLEPFHVSFEPGTFSPLAIITEGITPARGDLDRAKNWYAAFLDQRERVAKDIQQRAQSVEAPDSIVDTAWTLISGNPDPAGSPSHPLWPALTKLRYQIQKLTYMQGCVDQITAIELGEQVRRMTIREDERVQVQSGDFENPAAFLSSTISRMEEEYKRLLDQVDRLFEIQLTMESLGRDPFIGEELTFIAQVAAEGGDGAQSFPDYVAGFEWAIRTELHTPLGEAVLTRLPKFETYFPRAGRHFIWVRALDAGGNTLASDILPAQPQPLSLVGTLELKEGDYENEPLTVQAAGAKRGELLEFGDFSFEVVAYDSAAWQADDTAFAEVVIDGTSFSSTMSNVTAMPAGGVLRVDSPLRFLLPNADLSLGKLLSTLERLGFISDRIDELAEETRSLCGVARQSLEQSEAVLDALQQQRLQTDNHLKRRKELSLRIDELKQEAQNLDAQALAAVQSIRNHWSRANQLAQAGCERIPAIQSSQTQQERQGLLSEIKATVSACASESHQADTKQEEIQTQIERLKGLLTEAHEILTEMANSEVAPQLSESETNDIQNLLSSVSDPVSNVRTCLSSIAALRRDARDMVAELQNRSEPLSDNTEEVALMNQIKTVLKDIETAAAVADPCPDELSQRRAACAERLSQMQEFSQSASNARTQKAAGVQLDHVVQQVENALRSSESSLAVAEQHTPDARRAVEDLALCLAIGEDLLQQSLASEDPSREEQLAQADCSMYPGTHAVWNEQENRPGCACLPGLVANSSGNGCIDCQQYWNTFQGSLQSGDKAGANAVLAESSACPWFQQGQAMLAQQNNQGSRCNQLLEAFYGAMTSKRLNDAQNILAQAQDCSFHSQAADILQTEACSQIQQSILAAIQSDNVGAAASLLNQARAMKCKLPPEALSLVQNAVNRKRQQEKDREKLQQLDNQLRLLEELTEVTRRGLPPSPVSPQTLKKNLTNKAIPKLSEINDLNYRRQCFGQFYDIHKVKNGESDIERHLFEYYNWNNYRYPAIHPLPCGESEYEFYDKCREVRFCTSKPVRIR